LSSFVGREAELRDIAELLQSHRLVTLLGPGGIGKTRLALQVAAEDLERRRDGVFFVDLSALRDARLVGPTIAATLGVHRAALREGDARAVRAAAKEGCSTGCEQAITDLRRTRWGLSGASPADQPAGWEGRGRAGSQGSHN
jgi:predicted ATPase